MVYEYVAKEGEVRIFGSNLARVRLERRTESLEGGRVGQLGDFKLGLLGYELTLEVCGTVSILWDVSGVVV